MKNYLYASILAIGLSSCALSAEQETIGPTPGQQAMIDRKYGMFLHYGMNTYLNVEWSDGTAPASTYNPPADIARKAAEWVANAKAAGMRSIVLTTKHHDGFCLWDSKYTDYDIAHPDITHKADIVKAVSDACKKENIAFSVYYSLWDRHEPVYKDADPYKYILFMKKQLEELMTQYGTVSELWFDGAWDRDVKDWHLQEVYDHVKQLQPSCQISTNWTLGKRPVDMQEGDSIVYFPSDFRLWDPFLPVKNDPKIYTHKGEKYYLPYECTQTISVLGNWFAHPEDSTVRDLEELEEIFRVSTANDNCLLLNVPPGTDGTQNPLAVQRIKELASFLGIENGVPFPANLPQMTSLTANATAQASSILDKDTLHWGPQYAIDSDVSTAWTGDSLATLDIYLQPGTTFKEAAIIIGKGSITKYLLQYYTHNEWQDLYQETIDPRTQPHSFMGYGFINLGLKEQIQTDRLRLKIEESNGKPSVYSIRLK